MQAIILAGGVGSRLYPYTVAIPKPLIPIADVPIIDIVLKQLAAAGVKHVILALGYMAEMVKAYVGNEYGLRITTSVEDKPLGTIAPLKLMKDQLEDKFLVMNGDILTDIKYKKLFDFHKKRNAKATVATYIKKTKLQLGVIENNDEGRIIEFREKPVLENRVSMGIYVFSKEIVEYIPDDECFGFDTLMHRMIEKKDAVFSYEFSGRWFDIGMHEDLITATDDFIKNKEYYTSQ